MNKRLFSLIAGIVLFFTADLANAQNNVSVNTFNGAAGVSIPFYTITSGGAALPIGISYNTSGVKPKDMEGTIGMGWNLVAGGSVRRVVRGLPDDLKKDSLGNTLLGWMYNTNQATINGHTFTNDGSTCSKETADISFITTNFSNLYDTEPDLFYVEAPGLSVKLVYDQTAAKFRPVPYQDIVVTFTTNNTTGLITSFTIKDDKGNAYYFANSEKVTESTDLTGNGTGVVNYFKNKYTQYKNSIIYDDAWLLSSVTDPTGQFVQVTDTVISARHSTDKVNLFLAGATSSTLQYNIRRTVYRQLPNIITTSNYEDTKYNNQIVFKWATDGVKSKLPYLSQVIGMGDTINLTVNPVTYANGTDTTRRNFLHSVSDAGCGSPMNYTFNYSNETYTSGTYYTTLSDSASKKWDYWGYNSSVKDSIPAVYVDPSSVVGYPRYAIKVAASGGSNYLYTIGYTGSSMGADTVNVAAGALSRIAYAAGGATTIKYQSNDYLDVPSNTVVKGGGIRVKQVIDYDGLDSTKNIVHNYSYINPSTSASSGKPVSLPAYAFTIPYTGSATGQALWAASTAICDVDMSPENHSIVYQYSRESLTNAGSTLYQYYAPATNWDVSATPDCSGCTTAEWVPTYDYMGRTSCTATYGQVKNDYYSYPFLPNPNYDFERGLLKQVTAYTDANAEVSESDYTYVRSYSSPAVIPALKFDYNTGTTGVMGYNKYNILTSTSELPLQVTKKVYDSPTLSRYQQSVVTYTYGANHKLPIKVTTTNSDNSILISNINYTKDFAADSGSNANVTAIYKLKQQNINVPVETWAQVQISGTAYTTKAMLTLFAAKLPANPAYVLYLPSQSFSYLSPDGVTNFAPFSISGQTTSKYSGYPSVPAANYSYYDYSGTLQTSDDGHHHKSTALRDYMTQRTVLTASNTIANDLAFNDFDSQFVTPTNNFTLSGTTVYVPAGHTGQGAVFSSTQTLSAPAVMKDSLSGNYVFSIWINSGSVSGTLSISMVPAIGSTLNYNKTFAATGNTWKYFEWKLPVTSFNGSFTTSITETLTGGTSIDIDDVLLYPDNAEVTTYGYDASTHFPNATTSTNGITTYYLVDKWGRMIYAYDRDRNILKKNTYVTPKDITGFVGPTSLTVSPVGATYTTNTPVTLSTFINNPCYASSITYKWDFGNGHTVVTTGGSSGGTSPSYIYPDSGTYTAKVTMSSPFFGSYTASTSVHVVPGTMNLTLSTNATSHATISSITFSQGGVVKYTATPATISTVHPLKEAYTIVVTFTSNSYQYIPATGAGYNHIELDGPPGGLCKNFSSTNTYTFVTDLTLINTLGFFISTVVCSGGGGD